MASGENKYQHFLKSIVQSPWTLATVLARSLGTLSVMKLVAVYFGSAGIALFSHFQNLIALITQVPDQGSNLAIIRLYDGLSKQDRSSLIGRVLLLNLSIFITIALILILFNDFFIQHFPEFGFRSSYFWLLLTAVFFILLNSLVLAFVYAQQAFRTLFFVTLVNVVILLAAIFLGVRSESISTVLIYYASGWGAYSFLNFLYLSRKGVLPKLSFRPNKPLIRSISTFLIIAVAGVALGKWVDYFVRDFAIDWFGIQDTGYWQAQVRLSDSYRSIFMGTLGLLFYSQVSKLINDPVQLKNYVRQMILLSLGITAVGLFAVWLLKRPLIILLFQSDLLEAASFIQYQLIADFFALPAFLLVFVLVAQKRTLRYVSVHMISALIYLLTIPVLAGWQSIGIESLPMANMFRMSVFLLILIFSQRKLLFR